MRRSVWIALVLAAASATPVSAQVVIGTVTEAGTGRALGGAWIALHDSAGAAVDATLAGADGRFTLSSARPGSYHVVARLIGYQDATSGPVVVGAGETVRHDVVVPVLAVSLTGISVAVERQCGGEGSGTGAQVARLWTEARKALEIVEWTESQGSLRMHLTEQFRELDAATLRVLAMREQPRRGIFSGSPYASLSAEALTRDGFILPVPDAPEE